MKNESDFLTALKWAWLIRHELSTLYGNKLRSETSVSQANIQGISKVLGQTSRVIPIKKLIQINTCREMSGWVELTDYIQPSIPAMQNFTCNRYNTFTIHVPNLITAEFLLGVKFTVHNK